MCVKKVFKKSAFGGQYLGEWTRELLTFLSKQWHTWSDNGLSLKRFVIKKKKNYVMILIVADHFCWIWFSAAFQSFLNAKIHYYNIMLFIPKVNKLSQKVDSLWNIYSLMTVMRFHAEMRSDKADFRECHNNDMSTSFLFWINDFIARKEEYLNSYFVYICLHYSRK